MKILVVEDNDKLAEFLHRALSEEGFVVDRVSDGASALDQARALPYDLVVLDWMLPDIDGLAVCRRLREAAVTVPLLMLTARGDVKERIAGLEAGADDYLAKPFDLGEFLARVKALGRRARSHHEVVTVGRLRIDRYERRVSVDGLDVQLTPREFALLAHLVGNAGRVVPKTELLAKVWSMSFDPGSNVVEVHVRKLREKLGPAAALLETVRGVGYRLEGSP